MITVSGSFGSVNFRAHRDAPVLEAEIDAAASICLPDANSSLSEASQDRGVRVAEEVITAT